jgi:hypothetical protein
MARCEKHGRFEATSDVRRPILHFAFWTSLYGSRQGRYRYDREVFREGWSAGREGRAFPFESENMRRVCYGHERVRIWLPRKLPIRFKLDPEQRDTDAWRFAHTLEWHRPIALNLFQRVTHEPIDWDHLIAYSFARKYLRDGRRNHHAMRWINQCANFSAIDARANRVLQDRPPHKKLALRCEESYANSDFIKTDPNLTAEECKLLSALGHCIAERREDDAKRKEEVDRRFRVFVEKRTQRIYDTLVARVGDPPRPPPID